MQHKAGLSWEPYRALLSPGPLQLPSWILLSRARSLSPPSPLPRTEQSVRWSKASGFRSDPEPSLPPEPCELSRHKTCTRQGSGLARGALFSRTDGCPILHAGPQQGTVSSAQRPAGTEGGKRAEASVSTRLSGASSGQPNSAPLGQKHGDVKVGVSGESAVQPMVPWWFAARAAGRTLCAPMRLHNEIALGVLASWLHNPLPPHQLLPAALVRLPEPGHPLAFRLENGGSIESATEPLPHCWICSSPGSALPPGLLLLLLAVQRCASAPE